MVKVASASVNPLDFKIRNGDLKLVLPFSLPLILGNDFAGVVVAVGKNVKNFKTRWKSCQRGRNANQRFCQRNGAFLVETICDGLNQCQNPQNRPQLWDKL
nr:alcohol dehydrogenase catalytic domain-containing protein [Moraxella oblonga]